MTAPATRENPAQLVPNWNSIGIPVATPMAKLMPKMRIQNRAASFQRSPPGRRPMDFIMKMSRASPMVSWGNR